MENTSHPIDPREARSSLDLASASRDALAARLRLPPYFHISLGAAVAFQVGTTAWSLSGEASGVAAPALLGGGLVVFFVVVTVQLLRFRRRNGAWVHGLMSRVVLGTSMLSSLVYAAGLAVAIWAGLADQRWILVGASLLTGAGYAEAGRRWWAGYRAEPEERSRGESAVHYVALATLVALGSMLLLVTGR